MSRTKEQLEDGELAQCRRFIEWRRKQFDEQFTIIGRPNPPDFILELSGKQTWLEVTDVFPKDEDVDWLLAVTPPSRDLENADDQFVEKAVKQLNTKLSKKSYLSCFNQLGQGFLMLTDRTPSFCIDSKRPYAQASLVATSNASKKHILSVT